MSESTSTFTYDELRAEVGSFLGWGTDPTGWSADQVNRIKRCVRSGLNQFYHPAPLEGEMASYDWSFMRPVLSITLPSGSNTIPLPDDTGGIEGQITINSTLSRVWYPIDLVNDNMVRGKFEEFPNLTGPPQIASILWGRGTTGQGSQRVSLFVFPTPDQSYNLQFNYYVNANYLDEAFPYHMGGAPHTETVIESCLAIAEQTLDDAATIHSAKFKERLAASINADRKMKPQKLGVNRDMSDAQEWNRQWNHFTDTILIYGQVR